MLIKLLTPPPWLWLTKKKIYKTKKRKKISSNNRINTTINLLVQSTILNIKSEKKIKEMEFYWPNKGYLA